MGGEFLIDRNVACRISQVSFKLFQWAGIQRESKVRYKKFGESENKQTFDHGHGDHVNFFQNSCSKGFC